MDVHQPLQDLPEHPPDPLPVLVEAALVDGVAQRLLVAVLHLDVHPPDLHLWQRPLQRDEWGNLTTDLQIYPL